MSLCKYGFIKKTQGVDVARDAPSLGYIADSDEEAECVSNCQPAKQPVGNEARQNPADHAVGQSQPAEQQEQETRSTSEGLPGSSSSGHHARKRPLSEVTDLIEARLLPTPLRCKRRQIDEDTVSQADGNLAEIPEGAAPSHTDCPDEPAEFKGYALRDMERVIKAMLPRYRHLLSTEELYALTSSFEDLSLHAKQLYARLLGRKWPQWIPVEGLGSRYKELGEEKSRVAMEELASSDTAGFSKQRWLLDTKVETAASLLVCGPGELKPDLTYGALLLEALPMPVLRQFAKGLGIDSKADSTAGTKREQVMRLLAQARRQKVLGHSSTAEQLLTQALRQGRWILVAPSPSYKALSLLTALFHMESSGAAGSSYMVFATRWPEYSLDGTLVLDPIFNERGELDKYLAARHTLASLEDDRERKTLEAADAASGEAEKQLTMRLAEAGASAFEQKKLHCPYRRRFMAAWCWADALHHLVMHAPACGANQELRQAKIRRLRLLLSSGLCIPKRGRWYNELAKEVAREEGQKSALQVVLEGLVEGRPKPLACVVTFDLTEETRPAEQAHFPLLPLDAQWDLAKRCKSLATGVAAGKRGGKRSAWRKVLLDTALGKAYAGCMGNHGSTWLASLIEDLEKQEAGAVGPLKTLAVGQLALPADSSGRRVYHAFDLQDLTVEQLAIRHYLHVDPEGYTCGIHCEGALLRDLFGVLLFDQLFDTSVEGVFLSQYQDAPLDLGTEAFFPLRRKQLENRLEELSSMPAKQLAEGLRRRFGELFGTRIRGVRWDRYEDSSGAFRGLAGGSDQQPAKNGADVQGSRCLFTRFDEALPGHVSDLGAVAGAVGGRALSAALRLLCEDYNSAGLPDLLVWSWRPEETEDCRRGKARFVEVKSEKDQLSRRQRLWLSTLRAAGAAAEVCHFRDPKLCSAD
eukprot:TRINITY_DN47555_c0_g1_i1.p1 TRINITY_DN47555_c0_g1~~TRINITY_DN47555_c0_g1_i1.p1  ORF type:complete len:951 (-),score=174.68 TRINITY_DN47555_c0_g1_i1:139-2904(-)